MVNKHITGYLNLSTHEHFEDDLAGHLDTAHHALFSPCERTQNGAIEELRISFYDHFKPIALHYADGHILLDFDISYANIGYIPAFLGEVRDEHSHNTNYRSISLQ